MLVMMNMVYMAIVTGRMMVGGASGGRRRGATPGKWSGVAPSRNCFSLEIFFSIALGRSTPGKWSGVAPGQTLALVLKRSSSPGRDIPVTRVSNGMVGVQI